MISLPLYPKMTKDYLEDVAEAVERIVSHYRI
jgi:dTDP-4-amino-4,6-dideoxygalactose transaminase